MEMPSFYTTLSRIKEKLRGGHEQRDHIKRISRIIRQRDQLNKKENGAIILKKIIISNIEIKYNSNSVFSNRTFGKHFFLRSVVTS
jgi:hypothetical protein